MELLEQSGCVVGGGEKWGCSGGKDRDGCCGCCDVDRVGHRQLAQMRGFHNTRLHHRSLVIFDHFSSERMVDETFSQLLARERQIVVRVHRPVEQRDIRSIANSPHFINKQITKLL